ncbi:MAG TPA: regulatory protein RecX [bacterium]|nr:regulatory protein RecX [bacterium]
MTEKANSNIDGFLKTALKLLSVRDYFSCELKRKLTQKGAAIAEVEKVMEYIYEYRYIDDESTLRKYSDELAVKSKGFNYLKKKLFEKGCSELLGIFDLRKFYTKDMEMASALKWIEKHGKPDMETVQRKLASRGFSSEIIYEVSYPGKIR